MIEREHLLPSQQPFVMEQEVKTKSTTNILSAAEDAILSKEQNEIDLLN